MLNIVSDEYACFVFTDLGEDRTAVHLAAYHAQYRLLYELIEMGASVNTPTIDGITPLHEACSKGNFRCARLLIKAGAQVSYDWVIV